MKRKSIRSYLLTGFVVWLPVIVTFVVLRFIIDLLDKSISLLPHAYQPEQLFGFHFPGFGVLFSLALLLMTGLLATNFLGQRLMRWSEAILDRIPLVRSIYKATKQVMETVFSSNSQAFRKVLLIEYPRKGLWSIAFQTGVASREVSEHTGEEMLSVFVPTTPNPTSGFLIMVEKSSATELSMSIDDALKLVISLGVMQANKPIK
ncbi:MAG: DUF502 domain-containing protein [Gammaproteobacteria bacterium]|nr:DUF502 domain-containing protein [Gammaproteobacteria bacterium]